MLAAPVLVAAQIWIVNVPAANMYSRATVEADVVSQAIYGASVEPVERAGGWLRVRTADDYTGWVETRLLRESETPYASSGTVARVESLFANLYRGPDVTKHQPLLKVPFETRLEIAAEPDTDNRRWLQVRLVDEGAAWVQRGDVSFREEPLSIEETIALSKRFLGLPYLWGGTSTFGYDCSGFTQMLGRQRGVLMPRDADPQARWDKQKVIEPSQLQPGDLVYFGPSPRKITHTGMYIGDGEFIHATTHLMPRVQISRLDEEHWTKLLVACRRPPQ